MLCTFDVSTETMPRVVGKFPIRPDHVVAQWVRSVCGSVVCKVHTDCVIISLPINTTLYV